MLKIDLKVGESIKIGDAIITLDDKSGKVARLAIVADKSIQIARIRAPNSAAHFAKDGIGAIHG